MATQTLEHSRPLTQANSNQSAHLKQPSRNGFYSVLTTLVRQQKNKRSIIR